MLNIKKIGKIFGALSVMAYMAADISIKAVSIAPKTTDFKSAVINGIGVDYRYIDAKTIEYRTLKEVYLCYGVSCKMEESSTGNTITVIHRDEENKEYTIEEPLYTAKAEYFSYSVKALCTYSWLYSTELGCLSTFDGFKDGNLFSNVYYRDNMNNFVEKDEYIKITSYKESYFDTIFKNQMLSVMSNKINNELCEIYFPNGVTSQQEFRTEPYYHK